MFKSSAVFSRIALVLALLPIQHSAIAAKYYCGRELNAAETAQAEQLMESMRKALPAPPGAGWVVMEDGGGVDCGEASQPVPARIMVRRSYLYMGEAAADSGAADRAKLAEHEQKLAGLKKEQEAMTADYRKAQAARDTGAMQPLQLRMRELQQAQVAQSREISRLRGEVQRKAAERKNAEWTAAQKQENKASVAITANQSWFKSLFPGGKTIGVPGATLAVRDEREGGHVTTQLYIGSGQPQGAEGRLAIDAAAPMLKLQNLAVRIDAPAQPTEQLLKGLDAGALQSLVKP